MMLLLILAMLLIIFFLCLIFKDWLQKKYREYVKGESSTFVVTGLLIFGLLLTTVPLAITRLSFISLKYINTGEIGDIIGGSTAPFIGFMGIIVTFYAFWVQYQSNINQRNDIRIERFENQFYEMLRLHRDNVTEMEIDNKINGRKCFVRMFDEFKFIYLVVYQMHFINKSSLGREYTTDDLCDIAYNIFFNGLSSISPLKLDRLVDRKDVILLKFINVHLKKVEKKWNDYSQTIVQPEYSVFEEDRVLRFEFEMFYYPFDGHNVRLGHYYRHLFQTVSFIAKSEIIPKHKDRYRYLKLLRAQLSNHEQLLLYYNGLSGMGNEWLTEKYFTDYRLIKNIPLTQADFGVKPVEKLGLKNQFDEFNFDYM